MTTSSIPAASASSTMSRMAGLAMPSRSTTGKELLLRRLGRGEEARPESRRRDDRLADPGAGVEGQLVAGQAEVGLDDPDDLVLVFGAPGEELGRAVALRADALSAPDVRPQRPVAEDAVEDRRRELLGADRRGEAVELDLGLDHQGAQGLRVALLERLDGLVDDPLVDRAEELVDAALELVLGDGEAAVEPVEDLDRVLAGDEVDDDEVHVLARLELPGVEPVAVEDHVDGPVAEGAALVHPAAARRGRDLSLVGELHLAADRHLEVVDAVEGADGEDGDGRARGQAFLDREVGPVVVDDQAADVVVRQDLVGDPADVAPEAALLGLPEEGARLHRDLDRPHLLALRRHRAQDEGVRVGLDVGVDPLVRPADEGVALLDVRVHPAVAAGPVRVFAEEADAPRDEELHARRSFRVRSRITSRIRANRT